MEEGFHEGNASPRKLQISGKGYCSHARRECLHWGLGGIVLEREYRISLTVHDARVQPQVVERDNEGSGSAYKRAVGENSNFHEGVSHAILHPLELERHICQTV